MEKEPSLLVEGNVSPASAIVSSGDSSGDFSGLLSSLVVGIVGLGLESLVVDSLGSTGRVSVLLGNWEAELLSGEFASDSIELELSPLLS